MITSFQHVRELLQRYVPFLDVDNPQVLGLVIVVFFGGLSFLYVFFQWHRKMSIHWMKKAALARRRYVNTDGVQFFLSFFLATPKEIVLAMWISLLHFREFTFYSDLQEPGNKNLFHGAS
jgi:hypothetical protein